MARFTNKVVAITGGGSGMGKTTCVMFASEGALFFISKFT